MNRASIAPAPTTATELAMSPARTGAIVRSNTPRRSIGPQEAPEQQEGPARHEGGGDARGVLEGRAPGLAPRERSRLLRGADGRGRPADPLRASGARRRGLRERARAQRDVGRGRQTRAT